MKFFKLIFLFILLIGVLFFIRESLPKGKMEIIPVSQLSKTSAKINNSFRRTEYYLIRNYVKNDSTAILLDQLICEKVAQYKLAGHSSFFGYFYKESWLVNLERIAKKDDTISMFGTNVYTYTWSKIYKEKIKKCIACTDLPDKEEVWIDCKDL